MSRKTKELEKALKQKFKKVKDDEVFLHHEDFDNGELTAGGYEKIKQHCEYISDSVEVEIKVPKEYAPNVKEVLEFKGYRELAHIKEDRKSTLIISVILLIIGVAWYAAGYLLSSWTVLKNFAFLQELIFVGTWVFTWAAIEKIFFDRTNLQTRRRNLMQVLSAKIVPIEQGVGVRNDYVIHQQDILPWGQWKVLHVGENVNVREIELKPGETSPLHRHKLKSENWIVTQGSGIVTINGKTTVLKKGDNIFVPAQKWHKMENNSTEKTILLEVGMGKELLQNDVEHKTTKQKTA